LDRSPDQEIPDVGIVSVAPVLHPDKPTLEPLSAAIGAAVA
jgi:hypothetical protein